MDKLPKRYWNKIILGIIGIVIIIVASSVSYVYSSGKHRQENLETTSVSAIKAALDYYYVNYNKYPTKVSEMQAILDDAMAGSYKITRNSISRLNDFRYEISGDEQTYRFSYINLDGKTITVKRNYQSDFHKY